MTVVVDTNVLIAMLIKKGVVREVIINNPGEFITPEWCFEELWKHRDVWNKKNQSEEELKYILSRLKRYIIIMDEKTYNNKLEEARKLIIDIDDAPLIALALSVENEGIWTYNTKHFDKDSLKELVKILNIKDVIRMYPFELEE